MFLFALLVGLPVLAPAAPLRPLAQAAPPAHAVEAPCSLDALLDALCSTESGGRDVTGDGGRAIGPYQIHRAYFLDSGIAGRYDQCRDAGFARRVVLAYWLRWCPDALERGDAEVLARVHNGGPRGARKLATLAYWHRVETQLLSSRRRP